METKTERNWRVQKLYEELMAEGKHGHYETMFRVVRLEVEREREACANLCAAFAGELDNDGGPAPSRVRNCAAFIRARSNAK